MVSELRVNSAKESKEGDRADVLLDISAVVLRTLGNVAQLSPVPGLSQAAGIAVSITGIVARARNNKSNLQRLSEDSTDLVYAIARAHKDIIRPEDVPSDLTENLRQLVTTLTQVQTFAQKGSRRNFFMAMLRSNIDANKIQDYREKLRQSLRVFGIQSDISIRDTVHKLAEQQVAMMSELKYREGGNGPESAQAIKSAVPMKLAPSVNSAQGQVKVTSVSGDSSVSTTNTNSHVLTNSTLNFGNTTTIIRNTYNQFFMLT